MNTDQPVQAFPALQLREDVLSRCMQLWGTGAGGSERDPIPTQARPPQAQSFPPPRGCRPAGLLEGSSRQGAHCCASVPGPQTTSVIGTQIRRSTTVPPGRLLCSQPPTLASLPRSPDRLRKLWRSWGNASRITLHPRC